jgi:hypothetical protein
MGHTLYDNVKIIKIFLPLQKKMKLKVIEKKIMLGTIHRDIWKSIHIPIKHKQSNKYDDSYGSLIVYSFSIFSAFDVLIFFNAQENNSHNT